MTIQEDLKALRTENKEIRAGIKLIKTDLRSEIKDTKYAQTKFEKQIKADEKILAKNLKTITKLMEKK